MKEKIRNFVVLEGIDLYLVSIFAMVLMALFEITNISIYIALICISLLGVGCLWFSLIWCIIHVCNSKDFTGKSKTIKILLLLFLNLFYIPIYYTKYVMKKKQWYGILGCVANIIVYIVVIILIFLLAYKTTLVEEKTIYKSKDELLFIELNNEWTCSKEAGEYDLYCYETYDDESFGLFNYSKRDDIDYLIDFHLDQEIDYYVKEGYILVDQGVDDNTGFYNAILKKDDHYILTVVALKYNTESFTTIIVYNEEIDSEKRLDFDNFGKIFNKVMISEYENGSI